MFYSRAPKPSRSCRPRAKQLGLEALESRQLLAIDVEIMAPPAVRPCEPTTFAVARIDSGTSSITSYQWEALSGPQGSVLPPSADTPAYAFTPSIEGLYRFRVVVTDDTGAATSDDHELNVARVAGEEFALDDALTAGAQQLPYAVAADGLGRFVVTWHGQVGQGPERHIFARRYDAQGVPISPPIQVSDDPVIDGRHHVAMNAFGSFVVVWDDGAAGGFESDIQARYFRSDGASLQPSQVIAVSAAPGVQLAPVVGLGSGGSFVVAWDDRSGDQSGVWYRGLNAHDGSEWLPATRAETSGLAGANPVIDMRPDGAFVLGWREDRGTGWDLFARRFSSAGVPREEPFALNATVGSHGLASVRLLQDGAVLAGWSAPRSEGGANQAFVQRFEPAPVGTPTAVSEATFGAESGAFVGLDRDENFVALWEADQDPDGSTGVYARRFAADGTPLGGQFRVHSSTVGLQALLAGPVAVTPDGNFLAAWADYGAGDPAPARAAAQMFLLGKPTANIGGPYVVLEGATLQLDASGSTDFDAPAADLVYEWDLAYDGFTFEPEVLGVQPTIGPFADNGSRRLALRVRDREGFTDLRSTELIIQNAPPLARVIGPEQVAINRPAAFWAEVTDPGSADQHTYSWSLEGPPRDPPVPPGQAPTYELTFPTPGKYLLRLMVSDDDGGTHTVEHQVLAVAVGDFDGNGLVDDADRGIWEANLGQREVPSTGGDADMDGDAEGGDFLAWQRAYGYAIPAPDAFVIEGPGGRTYDGTPLLRWQGSNYAYAYDVRVCADADCASVVQESLGFVGTQLEAAPLPEGDYVVQVLARNARGATAADNHGLAFSVRARHELFATADLMAITSNQDYPPSPGRFGNQAAADWQCTNAAATAGLAGTEDWDGEAALFKAILSTNSVSAASRIDISREVINTNGTVLATSKADLFDGSLAAPVDYDEWGQYILFDPDVWTGSTSIGTWAGDSCGAWGSGGLSGRVGDAFVANFAWLSAGFIKPCAQVARLYCVGPAVLE